MKHKKLITAALFLVLLGGVFFLTDLKVEDAKAALQLKSKNYHPVSVNTTGSSEFIAVNQGTSLEMLSASYWVRNRKEEGADPDAAILTGEQIQYFNYANRKMVGISNNTFDLEEVGTDFSGKKLCSLIREMIDSFNGLENYYLEDGSRLSQERIDSFTANTAMEQIPDLVQPRFGFSVRRDSLQRLPSDQKLYRKNATRYFDRMPNTDLLPCEPVAILWTSADGEWSLVLQRSSGGWVKSDALCVCENKEEWQALMDPENFLIVTGKELRIGDDPYEAEISGRILPMGTKLRLLTAQEAPAQIHKRSTFGCYVAAVPVRGEDGSYAETLVPIPAGDDVHIGYLEFTEANLLELAFKHLGALYGWAGENNAQDCSGYAKEVYACFGIVLPRTSVAQTQLQAAQNHDLRYASAEKKLELLKTAPAGSILYLPGHIMLYTGMVGGEPYCISSVSSYYNDPSEKSPEILANQVALNSLVQTYRGSGEAWIDAITSITVMKQ